MNQIEHSSLIFEYLQWLSIFFVLSGSILNAKGNKLSFVVLNTGNIFSIISSIFLHQWALVVMFVGLSLINTIGYLIWKKKKIGF